MIQPALERLANHARQWNVTIESTQRTETSVIAFGMSGTRPVVLKVAKRAGEEWRSGELLAAFQGKGLVRPLEFTDGAVLLDRALPGHSLVDVSTTGHDEEATEIISTIIEEMSSVRPVWSGAFSVSALASEFQIYGRSCEGLVPSGMVEKAESVFTASCASQSDIRLLHGDLHHDNLLFDSARGWLAIDPWGIQAEIEYELAASLRNPIDAPSLLASADTMLTRLKIFEKRLGVNPKRALQWAFSSAVLAALWPTREDGTDMRGSFVTAATTMMALLND